MRHFAGRQIKATQGREVPCPASHSWGKGYSLHGLAAPTTAQEGKAADDKFGAGVPERGETR